MIKFKIGDMLTNRKKHHNNVEFYCVVVGFDDTYTWVKRLDSPDSHKPVRYPTVNMDRFFNLVSRAE